MCAMRHGALSGCIGFGSRDVAVSVHAAANGSDTSSRGSGHSVAAFKVASAAGIKEYFDSSDAKEVTRVLADLDEQGMMNIFVKQARCRSGVARRERWVGDTDR
jgi:hypothetical protein